MQSVETIEGQVIYRYGNERTSWDHSDPTKHSLRGKGPYEETYPASRPKYEVLSYCWGLAEPQELITVEIDPADRLQESESPRSWVATWLNLPSGSTSATLSARSNLVSALRHLRNNSDSRLLWIDAVCIIQDSNDDKISQICIMDSIYSNAYLTISAARAPGCGAGFLKPSHPARFLSAPYFLPNEVVDNVYFSLTTPDIPDAQGLFLSEKINGRGWTADRG